MVMIFVILVFASLNCLSFAVLASHFYIPILAFYSSPAVVDIPFDQNAFSSMKYWC